MVSRVDIITQLQDHFCGLADEMYQSIGVLQTQADLRVCFDTLTEEQRKRQGLDTQKPLEPDQLRSLAQEYAQQISRRSTRIDRLLDELPAQTSSEHEQLDALAALETKNQEERSRLDHAIVQSEALLESVRAALRQIATESLNQAPNGSKRRREDA